MKKLLTFFATLLAITPVHAQDSKQYDCLATAIYHEARGEPLTGMAAVARVVINRVKHGYAKDVCSVVHQSTIIRGRRFCQFSWACAKKVVNYTDCKFHEAMAIAKNVIDHDAYSGLISASTLFFHSVQCSPLSQKRYVQVARIGRHRFYQLA